jgi:hypothetical protein
MFPAMTRGDQLDRPTWKVVLLVAAIVSWPVVAIVRLVQSIRFRRIAHQAHGWTWVSSSHGIEATRRDGPTLELSWGDLARAHWVVHRKPEMGWDEQCFALSIPEKGVALSDNGGDLQMVLDELARRGVEPRLANGGKGFGTGDGLLAFVWMVIAGIAVLAHLSGHFR